MAEEIRQHKRIDKVINLQFSVADQIPVKWDICKMENISEGGLKFIAQTDLNLNGKLLNLKIRLPELAPSLLEIQGIVVGFKPRFNPKLSDVRVKFINISETSKAQLAIIEEIINRIENKNN